jgi:hypothetical protein
MSANEKMTPEELRQALVLFDGLSEEDRLYTLWRMRQAATFSGAGDHQKAVTTIARGLVAREIRIWRAHGLCAAWQVATAATRAYYDRNVAGAGVGQRRREL